MIQAAKNPIDFLHLSQQSGADQQLESELIVLFSQQCARQIAVINDQFIAISKRRDSAHTLKGAALAVGAWRVAKAADDVEASLCQAININLDEMNAAVEEACHFIAGLKLTT